MAVAAFRENKQMTLPVTSERNPAFQKFLKSIMTANHAHNDPVQAENDVSPDIKHGKDTLVIRTDKIVDKYNTEDKAHKDAEERAANGGQTDLELYKAKAIELLSLYKPEPIYSYTINIVPPGYTAGTSQIGSNGTKYTPILDENGEVAYFDSFASCTQNKGGLSSTTPPQVNDDLIDDSQKYNITYKVDAQGNQTERTPVEANLELALTRMDNRYTKLPYQLDMIDRISAEVSGATTFKSSIPSGIKTDVKPSEPFASAVAATDIPVVSKSIMFQPTTLDALKQKPVAVAPVAPALEPAI